MLLLAGLMGTMAVGAAAYVLFGKNPGFAAEPEDLGECFFELADTKEDDRSLDLPGTDHAADPMDDDDDYDDDDYDDDYVESTREFRAIDDIDVFVTVSIDPAEPEEVEIAEDSEEPVLKEHEETTSTGASAALAHWLEQEHLAEVTDFSTEEDSLMIVYDDQQMPNPVLGIEPDEHLARRLHVTLNGERVAAIENADGFCLDHINLVAQSVLSGIKAA